jgi:hypothetical protein
MKLKLFFSTIIILFVFALTSSSQSSSDNQLNGHIYVTVKDVQDAFVASATVQAKSWDQTFTTQTNEDGIYKLNLPVGIYQIVVSSQGFCASTRAQFKVEQDSTINFDFMLNVCPSHGSPPFKTESFAIPYSKDNSLKLFVQYGKQEVQGEMITFEGFPHKIADHIKDIPVGVIVSYNLLTIRANKIEMDRQTVRLKASGDVVFANGRKQVNANIVEVIFREGVPEINIQ